MNKENLRWPQIDAAMRYIYDNPSKYDISASLDILEFGVGSGRSLQKIIQHVKEIGLSDCNVYGFDSWEGLPAEKAGLECFGKFTPGSYRYYMPCELTLRHLWEYNNVFLYATKFEKLDKIPYFDTKLNAILVHIDCDLYLSAKQALRWCFSNGIIKKNTLVAFDEFKSTNGVAGEELAWQETRREYSFETEEIWHSTYYDKAGGQKFRQSLWEIVQI